MKAVDKNVAVVLLIIVFIFGIITAFIFLRNNLENMTNFNKYTTDSTVIAIELSKVEYLSKSSKLEILSSINEVEKKYSIPSLLIYGIIKSESNFRFDITHKPITINIDNKKIHTAAIGLGGIIYEFWKDSLITNNIIETKTDLYKIKENILSIGYIVNKLTKQENGNIDSIICKYVGSSNIKYKHKISNTVFDLWYKQKMK